MSPPGSTAEPPRLERALRAAVRRSASVLALVPSTCAA
jgi:hypothetical protein